jgi:adenylate cyclase
LRSDGTLAGVLGMDMSADKILNYERDFLLAVVGISVAVCLFVVGLGLFFARSLSSPLISLAADMAKIQSLDLDAGFKFKSKIREVLNMGIALENMKKGLRSFRKYVPAELVTELIALEKEAVLGVEKRNITVFFSDIADFTTIAEKIGVEKLAVQLGDYFEVMTKTILSHQGSVDKFIGDAVMAFWGAPRHLEEHAISSCLAALDCQRNLDLLFAKWSHLGIPVMKTRMGLNSGEVVVGNVGYRDRLSYTALGDNVNVAARLEALNKVYDSTIIISETTYSAAKHAVIARPIDSVVVKGKSSGAVIYELLAEKHTVNSAQLAQINNFTEAFYLYLSRKWKESAKIFKDVLKNQPNDKPTIILLERCNKFAENPPPSDWTGMIYLRDK